ncbi:MAG: nucleotide exchange factor GrpE [bacterium]|nr:nucleotide exchange factor GrpE [bacterium]
MRIPIEILGPDGKPLVEKAGKPSESERNTEEAMAASREPTAPAEPDVESLYLDQLRRLKAEFDNYRKRVEKEKSEFFGMAKGRVITGLLPVLDDLERMAMFAKSAEGDFASGVELIFQKMKAALSSEGLSEIKSVGQPFDPEFHEAIETVACVPEQDGMVVEELQRGYTLQGRLLRPSRVRVGKSGGDGPAA